MNPSVRRSEEEGGASSSVALHGHGGSGALVFFELMDHEEGDQQTHELWRRADEFGEETLRRLTSASAPPSGGNLGWNSVC